MFLLWQVDVALATIQLRSVKCVKLLENKKIEQQDKVLVRPKARLAK